jgi:2-hydroxyacyl-CoA lyase 1
LRILQPLLFKKNFLINFNFFFLVVKRTPPLSLLPECHYEKLAQLGQNGKGFLCKTIDELTVAVKEAIEHTSGPSLINVLISPVAQRKPQEHDWLTRSKL